MHLSLFSLALTPCVWAWVGMLFHVMTRIILKSTFFFSSQCSVLYSVWANLARCNLVAAEGESTNKHPHSVSGIACSTSSAEIRCGGCSSGSPVLPVQMGELGCVLQWSEVIILFQDECLLLSIFLIFPWSSSASVHGDPFVYFFCPCNPGFLCFRGGWGSRAPRSRLFSRTPKESLSSSTSLTLQVIVQSWKSCCGKHLALFCTFHSWFQPGPEPLAEFIPVKSLPPVLTHNHPGWFGVKGP